MISAPWLMRVWLSSSLVFVVSKTVQNSFVPLGTLFGEPGFNVAGQKKRMYVRCNSRVLRSALCIGTSHHRNRRDYLFRTRYDQIQQSPDWLSAFHGGLSYKTCL